MASNAILPIIRRAQRGDADSQFRLGCVYLDGGEGLAANERTAYMWLNRAASQGIEQAWLTIGERLSPNAADGDPQLARWYELAAATGSLRAKRMLAQTLVDGTDGDAGPDRRTAALILLRDAAAYGDPEACRDLGRFLLAAPADPSDPNVALSLLEQAFDLGLDDAAPDLADYYWTQRALELARRWYERCPEPRNAEQCYRLGVLNVLFGLPGNSLLERAAGIGHAAASEELGIRLATGSAEHRRDLKKAARWLEPAATDGSARAAYLLATIYRHRASGAFDDRRARRWLFRAARLGHGEACLRAGKAILRGINAGSPAQDDGTNGAADVAATEFLVVAARHGLDPARRELERLIRPIAPSFLSHPDAWSAFIRAAAKKDPEMGARVKLGHALGLNARELLAIEPRPCDLGEYFVVSIVGRRPLRRRIVMIETASQRQSIDEAQALLRELTARLHDAGLTDDFRSRYLKLRHLSRQFDHPIIDAALFPRAPKTGSDRTLKARPHPQSRLSPQPL